MQVSSGRSYSEDSAEPLGDSNYLEEESNYEMMLIRQERELSPDEELLALRGSLEINNSPFI